MSPAAHRPSASPRRIVGATLLAVAAAAATLVMFVLPAEYGIDPLGTGKALDLLALAEPERPAVEVAARPYRSEAVSFELQPFESVEYKYRLNRGRTMVFAWRADGELVSELHAEPDGAVEGFAESFHRDRGAAHQGTYRAPFAGWHGWFWENRTGAAVSVTLEAAGYYTAARTYRGGHVREENKDPTDG